MLKVDRAVLNRFRDMARALLTPPPPTETVRAFLRELHDRGGEIPENDPLLALYAAEERIATQRRYITWGSGWNVTVRLTVRGSRALAAP